MNENENQNEIKRGGITVETEHIFPIIKKWLYSEKEIFLREIVSNACDAVTKLKRLSSLGEVSGIDEDAFRVDVTLNEDEGTLTVTDNGIGMSEDELTRYICQIALSGALDFINKYEGSDGGEASGIIGHFGLGFYSSFMVSDEVEIVTKSYTDAKAVKWTCGDDGEYEISDPEPDETPERGTSVIMHISEDESEFLSAYKIRSILEKYCSFMPTPIYFTSVKERREAEEHKKEHEHDHDHDDGCECDHDDEPKPINDVHPLWQKNPSECTEEEYKEFYRRISGDYREPLFWIHIAADYPLNFKGILYFPRITNEYESLEGQVKLYYNQVFVADNIKEVIPEYLLMLRGVLDCPELPLNVSRSYLQNNTYVAKISQHIVKKVADKLTGMFSGERENYEKLWDDIKTFVEYGCIRDRKFYDRLKDAILLPLTDGGHKTPDEYLEAAKEKHEGKIYYANDKTAQAQYVAAYNAEGIEVALLDTVIDTQFIPTVENDKKCKFFRVDADVADALKSDDGKIESSADVEALFRRVSGNDKLTVTFSRLKDKSLPAVVTEGEESRRMQDMMKLYGMGGVGDAGDVALTVNVDSELIKNITADPSAEASEKIARHIWHLCMLTRGSIKPEELREFLAESYDILGYVK